MVTRKSHFSALFVVAVVSLASGCASGAKSVPLAEVSLRSLGVHFNPSSGLLVVTAGPVTTKPGMYPDLLVAYADVGEKTVENVPVSCSGDVAIGAPADAPASTAKLQYRGSAGSSPLTRENIVEWAEAELVLTDCGPLSGSYMGRSAIFPQSPGPIALAEDGQIWEIIPILSTQITGMVPSLPVRLSGQFIVGDGSKDDGSWTRIRDSSASEEGLTGSQSIPEITATLISNVGNSKTTRVLGIRALLPGAATASPVARVGKQSTDVCRVSGELVEFFAVGMCDVRVALGSAAAGVRVEVRNLLPRSDVDRPGGNVLDIKPLYITFKGGADEGHDINGLIATMVSGIADFYAEQRPGFELRVDTYDGLPDIQHLQLPVTREEFLANWTTTYGPLPQYLKQMGIDLNVDPATGIARSYETTNRIYVGVIETVTGGREGFAAGHTTAGCWPEALQGGGVMFYARNSDNQPCTERFSTLKYQGSTDTQFEFDNLRRIYGGSGLRSMPGCNATFNDFYMRTPDESDESLVKQNDPVRYPYLGPKNPPWIMDEDGRFYLRIKDGPRVGNPCYDIAYSSFFMRMGSSTGQNDSVAGRVTTDRADDSTAPQVKAYYVLAADSVDDRFDVGGQIVKQITSANEWLFTNGGKRLRWDTFNGEVDVQFVRLKQTEAELWLDPDDPSRKCRFKQCPSLETIVLAMQSQGLATRSKIAAVFYGGQRSFSSHYDQPWCAWGGYGKAGHVAMYLVADLNMFTGSGRCSNMDEFAKPANSQNTVGLAVIHEVFHALGIVAFSGTPNGDGDGHIKDDLSDLMGGSQGIVRLDPGNDDYWRHGKSFADGYRSAFMEPAEPGASFPEKWGK